MAGYTVQHVEERPNIGAAGNLVQTTVIFIETTMGAKGSLEIPTANYQALTSSEEGKSTLRQLLQDKADSLEAPFEM